MIIFSPMHHEKYVLVVILALLKRMEHTREDSDGSVVIVERNSDKRSVHQFRESGKIILMVNKPTLKLVRNSVAVNGGYNNS